VPRGPRLAWCVRSAPRPPPTSLRPRRPPLAATALSQVLPASARRAEAEARRASAEATQFGDTPGRSLPLLARGANPASRAPHAGRWTRAPYGRAARAGGPTGVSGARFGSRFSRPQSSRRARPDGPSPRVAQSSPEVRAGPRRPAQPARLPRDLALPSRHTGELPSHERGRARRAPGDTGWRRRGPHTARGVGRRCRRGSRAARLGPHAHRATDGHAEGTMEGERIATASRNAVGPSHLRDLR
jgi:hypothetical protein